MDKDSSKRPGEQALFTGEAWLDPIEASLRGRIRSLIKEMVEQELEAAPGRGHYERAGEAAGHRHEHRRRQLTGSFGRSSWPFPRPPAGRGRHQPGIAQRCATEVCPADVPARGADRQRLPRACLQTRDVSGVRSHIG
jgi:hypothetical protein